MSKSHYKKGYEEGASSSIEKTIREIEALIQGKPLPNAGILRSELRDSIKSALIELSKTWYKKGFNRGHKESYRSFMEYDEFPKELSVYVSRSLIPNYKHKIKLKSRLKDDFIEEIEAELW